LYIQTKGFLAYEGGLTEWSPNAQEHPSGSRVLTIKFANVVVNIGGIDTANKQHIEITVNGNYWGEYDVMQIQDSSSKSITPFAITTVTPTIAVLSTGST